MSSDSQVKRLPSYVLSRGHSIPRTSSGYKNSCVDEDYVAEDIGIRRMNEACLEVYSGARVLKNSHGSAIGVLLLFGIFFDVIFLLVFPQPYPIDIWVVLWLAPVVLAAIGGLLYLSSRRSGNSYVRFNREARRLYYVIPGEQHVVVLDWEKLQPVAGYLPISGGFAGHTVLYPLFLVGVDWNKSPPQETAISCGNLGWRDNGESAQELWNYIEHFMDRGPQLIPVPPPLPPAMSRKETFLYGYRKWVSKFREDLSTPQGKRWAVLWAPAKVLWLITMVFPESIGAYLDYSVPEVKFPAEIDALCGFESSSSDA